MTDERDKRIWLPGLAAVVNVEYGKDATAEEMRRQRAEIRELRAELDRRQRKERYDQVLARYNRAHGQNPKITLKQICDEMGESYDAVLQHRSRTRKRKKQK